MAAPQIGDLAGGVDRHIPGQRRSADDGDSQNRAGQPAGQFARAQRVVERGPGDNRRRRVHEELGHPGHEDDGNDEDIIPLEPTADGFEFADLE